MRFSAAHPANVGAAGVWPGVLKSLASQLAGGLLLVDVALLLSGRKNGVAAIAGIAFGGLAVALAGLRWEFRVGSRSVSDGCAAREVRALCISLGFTVALIRYPHEIGLAIPALAFAGCAIASSAVTHGRDTASFVLFRCCGAGLLLGTAGAGAWGGWMAPSIAPRLALVATVIRTALFAWEWALLLRDGSQPVGWLRSLATGELTRSQSIFLARQVLFAVSTVFSVMAMLNTGHTAAVCGSVACSTTCVSQGLERYEFFLKKLVSPGAAGAR